MSHCRSVAVLLCSRFASSSLGIGLHSCRISDPRLGSHSFLRLAPASQSRFYYASLRLCSPALTSPPCVSYCPCGGTVQCRRRVWKLVEEKAAELWAETGRLWRVAAPIAFTTVCNFATYSISYVFVGHIGEVELSAVGMCFSVFAIFTFGLLTGMGSALETLCGQGFGAGEVDMLSTYVQRAWIILFLTNILQLPLYLFTSPILKCLGQTPQVADLAGHFNLMVIPRMFALGLSLPSQKFLQSQSKVWPVALSWIIGLSLNVGLLYLFVDVLHWGLRGVAAAYNIAYWSAAVTQLAYVGFWCGEAWKGLSLKAFEGIWAFAKLSASSAVMLCLEIWNSTTMVLLAGHLPDVVAMVGALSVCLNISGYETMLFIGMNAAISVRVSNELGLGHARAAKRATYIMAFQAIIIGLLAMAITILARHPIAALFSKRREVQHAVSSQAWLLGLKMLLDTQIVLSGVAVGAGWQTTLAYINLACYYALGLPLAYVLAYKAHLGVDGIWTGTLIGMTMQMIVLLVMLFRTNWNREVEQTAKRLQKWGGERHKAAHNPPAAT